MRGNKEKKAKHDENKIYKKLERTIFEPGDWFWFRKGMKKFPALRKSKLFPYIARVDLGTNRFQEGGNDVIQASTKLLEALLISEKKSQDLNTCGKVDDLNNSSSNMLFQALNLNLEPWPSFEQMQHVTFAF